MYVKGQLRYAQVHNLTADPTPAHKGLIWIETTTSNLLKFDDGAAVRTLVTLDNTQTLSGKTLTTPALTGVSTLMGTHNGSSVVLWKMGTSGSGASTGTGIGFYEGTTTQVAGLRTKNNGSNKVSLYFDIMNSGSALVEFGSLTHTEPVTGSSGYFASFLGPTTNPGNVTIGCTSAITTIDTVVGRYGFLNSSTLLGYLSVENAVGSASTSGNMYLYVNNAGSLAYGIKVSSTLVVSMPGTLAVTGLITASAHLKLDAASEARFYNAGGTFYVGFKGGNAAANKIWTLPLVDGTNGYVLKTDGSGTLSWVANTATAFSGELILNTGNGYGAVNTKIRRFTTAEVNTSADVTYADSANNGMSATAVTDGIYSIDYVDHRDAGTLVYGISVNSSNLTTAIDSIPTTERKAFCASAAVSAASRPATVTVVIRLTAGDVVRAHTDGNTPDTTALSRFSMRKISN